MEDRSPNDFRIHARRRPSIKLTLGALKAMAASLPPHSIRCQAIQHLIDRASLRPSVSARGIDLVV